MAQINIRDRNKNKPDKKPNWEYRFEAAKVDGKRKHISKSGFRTKKEALEAGTKALAEYNNAGLHFEPSDISVAGSKIADVMLDTLPYAQQKEKLPQLKLKLVDLFLEIENDYMLLQRNEITADEAIKKLYAHRNAWIKSLS